VSETAEEETCSWLAAMARRIWSSEENRERERERKERNEGVCGDREKKERSTSGS
jgi:hypothetical protein